MIHLYCGDGKGKTTAAIGLAVRMAGYNKKVVILQFLKNSPTGELVSLARIPEITLYRGKSGAPFTFEMSRIQKEETKKIHEKNLKRVKEQIEQNNCDLLVLDEVVDALNLNLVPVPLLKDILDYGLQIEIVMTGRNPEKWIVDLADYYTEMKKIKHPYDQGKQARKGIEF